jgi:hypothetical protein
MYRNPSKNIFIKSKTLNISTSSLILLLIAKPLKILKTPWKADFKELESVVRETIGDDNMPTLVQHVIETGRTEYSNGSAIAALVFYRKGEKVAQRIYNKGF